MKKLFVVLLFIMAGKAYSQSTNDILNLLIANKTLTQEQADSLRAEAAIKQQDADANKKTFLLNAARQMSLSGYTQVRYQGLDERGKKDGFDIRRARLDLIGNLTPYLSYRFQTELADKPKLLDAYAEIKLNDYFNITVGQFKIPFSIENLASLKKFEMIDFSQAVDALVARSKDVIGNQNGRDIGIQLGGALWKKDVNNLVEYRIGVMNGSGINIADTANEAKDIVGRFIINPFKGFSVGGSFYNGWGKAVKPSARYAGRSQPRNRVGFEINYAAPRLSLRGEYIQGTDGKTDRAGWYAWAGYFIIRQKLQLLAKLDTYDPDRSVGKNISTLYVAGVNYNFNNWSRLQAFYTFREEQGTSVNNNYFSIQYFIGF
jgi:phosphate-selective porin OprO and OprP